MGKTIALKLNKKEEQIVSEWNKKGLTNSDLLRTALRRFFETSCDMSSGNPQMRDLFVKQNQSSGDFSEAVKELTVQMQAVQEQLKKTQQQMDCKFQLLQRQLSLLPGNIAPSEQMPGSVSFETVHAVHQQVDELLWKQSQNDSLKDDMD